jgi:hypothetical protein
LVGNRFTGTNEARQETERADGSGEKMPCSSEDVGSNRLIQPAPLRPAGCDEGIWAAMRVVALFNQSSSMRSILRNATGP